MSKLEEIAKSLIAHKLITSTTGSVSDRAKLRMEKAGKNACEMLKKRKPTEAKIENIEISLRWNDEKAAWARNINLAIEEFKQKHKKWGEVLDETIAKHRKIRRAYIEFGGEISEEFYINAICDVMKGTTSEEAKQIYKSILIMEKRLKKEKGPYTFLIPE